MFLNNKKYLAFDKKIYKIPSHTNQPGTKNLVFMNMNDAEELMNKFVDFQKSYISRKKIVLKTGEIYFWENLVHYTQSSITDPVPIIYTKN